MYTLITATLFRKASAQQNLFQEHTKNFRNIAFALSRYLA
jgi:hypothetical protein